MVFGRALVLLAWPFGFAALACSGTLEERNLPGDGGSIDAGPGSDGDLPETDPDTGACPPSSVTYHFDVEIQKDIDDYGCSGATCHGGGAGGLKLTAAATGPDLDANYAAFRMRAMADEGSKILTKGTGGDSHGGGMRFAKTDAVYMRWLTWIRECQPR